MWNFSKAIRGKRENYRRMGKTLVGKNISNLPVKLNNNKMPSQIIRRPNIIS